MNAAFEVFPAQGIVLIGLANIDPPVIERLVDYYTTRMPLANAPVAAH